MLGDPFNFVDVDSWEFIDACHANATCSNTNGTFNCSCIDGHEFEIRVSDIKLKNFYA